MSHSMDNTPDLWHGFLPYPQIDTHKYSRGTALIRGGALMTGAARLAARAAQRAGAGLVTVAAPTSAWPIYATALESVIVRPCDSAPEWQQLLDAPAQPAVLIGPGLGATQPQEIFAALAVKRPTILDADALTAFADNPTLLFDNVHPDCVLTPHEGEFTRLFGDINGDKPTRAAAAATRAGCVVLLKGSETVIAAPNGQTLINRNAPPWLATAGSGDVLAGIILGLVAQKMPAFWATAASAWLHGQIAAQHGMGLVAEDIVAGVPKVLQAVQARYSR